MDGLGQNGVEKNMAGMRKCLFRTIPNCLKRMECVRLKFDFHYFCV